MSVPQKKKSNVMRISTIKIPPYQNLNVSEPIPFPFAPRAVIHSRGCFEDLKS
jgi:hypothetical protein